MILSSGLVNVSEFEWIIKRQFHFLTFLNRDHDRCFLTPLFLMQDEVKTWGLSLFKFVTREISFWVYVTREFW